MNDIVVPQRFHGPPRSGNGGWSSGALACAAVGQADHADPWPPVTVRLLAPPPLDVPMPVTHADGWTVMSYEDRPVAQARLAEQEPADLEPVPADRARAASARYAGLHSHPFPTCFTCGPDRDEGDGLRIFPGPLDGGQRRRVACTWTPSETVAEDWHCYAESTRQASETVAWAAMDCIGAWAGDIEERPMVLGTITVSLRSLPVVGVEHVLVGELRGTEGRKTFTSATMRDPDGTVVASAEHTWITVDPALFS